jgi:hypothetical protein
VVEVRRGNNKEIKEAVARWRDYKKRKKQE